MRNKSKARLNRCLALCLAGVMAVSFAGCSKNKKEPRPEPKATAKIDKGNANAGGSGKGQADVPLMAGTGTFSREFNPFLATSEADRQAVDLTQIRLVTNDRAGKLVYRGIDGELRNYKEKDYTYYGASDLTIHYDKAENKTVYNIRLREDMSFSDGQKLTADDVLFTLYALCDNSYAGLETIKNMPIKGLLNYQANSTKAESFSEKSLIKKIKKNKKKFVSWLKRSGYSALADRLSHGGKTTAELRKIEREDGTLFRRARFYFSRGKGKRVKSISGIRKLGDHELSVETEGYNRRMSAALQIPVCALHYYGDMTKFRPEAGQFGFRRGDISSVLANKSSPMGAGAYRFVKYEDGVVYYTSNELYFLGCPQIAYLQLKEMTDILEETKKTLAQKVAEESITHMGDEDAEVDPDTMTNPSAEVAEIKGGTVDILEGTFRGEEQLGWIATANSNKELEGSTIAAKFVSDGMYRYLGINARNVSVGGQPGSEQSKSLRRAFAVIFSAAKYALKERDGVSVELVSSPLGRESWVSPDGEGQYENIFEKNTSGGPLYESESSAAERMEIAEREAVRALEQAGYKADGYRVTAAPQRASMTYSLWIAGGTENPFYDMVLQVAEAFKAIGMNLKVESLRSMDELNKKLATGSQQLWIGMRDISDVDLQGRYASTATGNYFGIRDVEMDREMAKLQTFLTSDERRDSYGKCVERLSEWAVEVPICEYQQALLFSSSRIKSNSIPENLTPYYDWMNEVQKMEMK